MYDRGKRYSRIRFWSDTDILREEYLDVYESIQTKY